MTGRRKLMIAVAVPALVLAAVAAWLAWYGVARTGVREMPLLARESAKATAVYGISVNAERGRCTVTTDREVIVYVVGGGLSADDHATVRCFFKADGERYPAMQELTYRVTGSLCEECKGFERDGTYASYADYQATLKLRQGMGLAAVENH